MRKAIPLLLAMAACGGDKKVVIADAPGPDSPPDAPPPDMPPDAFVADTSCKNNPAPTTATDPITLSGTAQGLTLAGAQPQVNPINGATVDTCRDNCAGNARLDRQTTAADGSFTTGNIATGGVPLDGYVRVAADTFRTTNVFPPAPLTDTVANFPMVSFSDSAFTLIAGAFGVTQSADNGAMLVFVSDCGENPVPGAVLSVKQNNVDVGTVKDFAALVPQAVGTFMVYNVPPGITEINATSNGTAFRAHEIRSFAGQTSASQVRPGF